MAFTQEELAAMAAADAEIEAEFDGATAEERARSDDLDVYLALSLTGVRAAKKRISRKARYDANRKEILARDRERRRNNRDLYAAYYKAYYESHKEARLAAANRQRKKMAMERPTREFGIRLRAARKAARLSADALGNVCGISEQALYDHEYGLRRRPNAKVKAWLEQEEQKHGKKEEHGEG